MEMNALKNMSVETLNFIEDLLTTIQKQLKVNTFEVAELYGEVIEISDIDEVIENIRYQIQCEVEENLID